MDAEANVSEPAKSFELYRRVNRHLAVGEVAQAKSLLNEEGKRWAQSGLLRLVAGRIAEAEGQSIAASELFRQAANALYLEVSRAPNDPDRPLALAQALIKCSDADGAKAALVLARERGADAKKMLRIEQRLALQQMDWPTLRRTMQRLVALEVNPSALDFVVLARACRNLNDVDGAANAAAQALQRDPARNEAIAIAAWVAMRQGDPETAIEYYRRLVRLAPDNPRFYFQVIYLLILSGKVREAGDELTTALGRWPGDPALRVLALKNGFLSVDQLAPMSELGDKGAHVDLLGEQRLRTLAQMAPRDSELRRPVMSDDKSRDVIIADAPNSDTTVLVFTALTDVVSMPLSIFDRYLAALGVTAIYLKDFNRLDYLRGINSLGDSYAATIEALRGLCRRLAARRLCTLGCSAGGFGAIRYGVELDVDRILTFSGETQNKTPVDDRVSSFAGETRNKTRRLRSLKTADSSFLTLDPGTGMVKQRLRTCVPAAELDLRDFLLSRRYSSKIELVYAEKLKPDEIYAQHLSGLEGVTIHPVANCDSHELLQWIALNGDLCTMLDRLLGLSPRADS